MPLRWRRVVCAQTGEGLLLVRVRYAGSGLVGCRNHFGGLEGGSLDVQQMLEKAPWSQWLCYGRAMLLLS